MAVGEKAPIWQISMTALDDEGAWVTLQRVGEHSEQMQKRVKLDEFLKDWFNADRRKELKAHPGWPHNRTVVTSQARAVFAKGAIFTAIGAAADNIEKRFPPTDKSKLGPSRRRRCWPRSRWSQVTLC